jgi:hypothetical protein
MVIIPTFQSTSSRYTIEVELNNVPFNLAFHWNARDAAWYMDISDANDILLLAGIKLVLNYALLNQYNYLEGLPDGEFFVSDTNTDNPYSEELTYDNFGDRYQLIFITNDELNG